MVYYSIGGGFIITDSNKLHPLMNINYNNSSWFHASKTPSSSRKQWILNHLHPSGTIIIDNGASKALSQNKSLLPAGVLEIKGKFKSGEAWRDGYGII